jgi:Mechanosensitive ion channel, conserved TM helix
LAGAYPKDSGNLGKLPVLNNNTGVVNLVDNQIMNGIYIMVNQFIAFIPTLVAIIILIIVGKILGTFLGKLGARALDRIGFDDLVDRTIMVE